MMNTPETATADLKATGAAVTVHGPVDAATLGITLSAEHLTADLAPSEDTVDGWIRAGHRRPATPEAWRFYRAPLTMPMLGEVSRDVPNRDNWQLSETAAVPDLHAFSAGGGGTVVEVTTPDLGRDPDALVRIAQSAHVGVVMGCGWSVPSPAAAGGRGADELFQNLIAELTTGTDGVRAGVIGRIGILDPTAPADRAVLDAVARATTATGAPVLIRPPKARSVHQVLDRLTAGGAELSRVAVDCTGLLAGEPETLRELAGRGVFLQFGHLGRFPHVYTRSDSADIAGAILALDRAGHTGQILVSVGVSNKSDLTAFGGGGYGFLIDQFLPYLRFQGADDRLVGAITTDNPQRWLTITEGGV